VLTNEWKLVSYLQGGNETHLTYWRQRAFGADKDERLALNFFSPRHSEDVLSPAKQFTGVTNWLASHHAPKVNVIQSSEDVIFYEFDAGDSIEFGKVTLGRAGLYNFRYMFTSRQRWLLMAREKEWLPIIRDAQLMQVHTWEGRKFVPSVN
jgi:hypothetical protein